MIKISKIIDLTGKRFGKLTVIKRDLETEKNGTYWLCICGCDCEKVISVESPRLRNGKKTDCGCVRTQKYNLAGRKFGNLTVIKRDLTTKKKEHIGYVSVIVLIKMRFQYMALTY